MDFVKLSISHEYLYSPKSWLHNQNISLKTITVVMHLILLPFIPLEHLLLFFFILLILCKSISLPHDLKKYFYMAFAVSSFFLLISIQKDEMRQSNKLSNRKMLHFYILNPCHKIDILASKQPNAFCLCLPVSTARFISLHFIYLVLIRCLLITTSHENIARTALISHSQRKYFSIKFIFTAIVSSHFLKILFEQIKAAKISYTLRNADIDTVNTVKIIFLMCLPCVQQFLVKTNTRIYCIASTLYSRNIHCTNLNIYD